MKSLDKMLTSIAPELPRETSLVNPVMVKIKLGQAKRQQLINRSLLGCFALALVTLVGAVVRGNSGKVIALAAHKLSSLPAHPGLYAQALLETLPWPTIAVIAGIALAARIMHRSQFKFARHATSALAVSFGALALTAGASAATITTAQTQPGPAQQRLERTVSGVGGEQAVIDNHLYQFDYGLTDNQIRAQAEAAEFRRLDQELGAARGTADGGTLSCMCKVVAITDHDIHIDYYESSQLPMEPSTLAFTPKTIFLNGSKRVGHLDLKPGDLIVAAPNADLKTAAYIAKLDLPYKDYFYNGNFSATASAHREDGKCYNNEADSCPTLTNSYTLINVAFAPPAPANTQIREAYGTIIALDDQNVRIQNASGTIWTFNAGTFIKSFESAKIGDSLRIEFWQPLSELSNRTIVDESMKITNMRLTKSQAIP